MNGLQTHKFTSRLFHHRQFRLSLFLLITLSIFLGVCIVPVEYGAPNLRIKTVSDGLWWAVTTVTGVGYGDMFPVTAGGRMIGAVLEISGVLMFGLIIGIIGITLSKRQEEYSWFRLFERLDQLEQRLTDIEKKNDFFIHKEKEF